MKMFEGGGPPWELKIDAEKLICTENKEWEGDSETRRETSVTYVKKKAHPTSL